MDVGTIESRSSNNSQSSRRAVHPRWVPPALTVEAWGTKNIKLPFFGGTQHGDG